MSDFFVIVIGAGLGGLCLAQGLRRAGVRVAAFERDASPVFRRQGYRIHIDADGDRALAGALPPHLYQLFRATAGVPRPETLLFDHQLAPVAVLKDDAPSTHLAVDRLTLRQILLAGLEDVVSFGKQLTGYEIGGDGQVTARFADGSRARGAVLVGADGIHSAVRRQYLPHARVVDTGLRQLYGRIWLNERTRGLFDDRMFGVFTAITGPEWSYVGLGAVERSEPVERAVARLAPGLKLSTTEDYVTCSFGARRERLPCSDDELRAMSGEALRDLVLRQITGWHSQVRQMIERWDCDSVFPLALRTSVPIEPWPTTSVTLLGDAIHAMSPAGGVGANTALRDAARLTRALEEVAGGRPLIEALRHYEAEMIDSGFAAVRRSAENGVRVLGQDPLPAAPG